MKTRTKKGKIWLSTALSLAMIGAAVGGFVTLGETLEAKADGEVTVGQMTADTVYTLNGTSDGTKSTISYEGDKSAYFVRVTVSGYTSGNVEVSMTSENAATIRGFLFTANGGWDWANANAIDYESMPAGEEYTKTFNAADYMNAEKFGDMSAFDLTFSFNSTGKNRITINYIKVAGVSYQLTEYDPDKDVEVAAPDKSFKEYADWENTTTVGSTTTTAVTIADGTLEAMPNTDERYENAIDNGAALITIPANATPVTTDSADYPTIHGAVEIPISEALTAWPTDWTYFYIKLKAENISNVYVYVESVNNCDECSATAPWKGYHAFNFSVWSGGAPSVSEGFRVSTTALAADFMNYPTHHENQPTKIVLAFVVKDTAEAASVEIGGMTFGGSTAPVFINDVGAPELAIGNFISWHSNFFFANPGDDDKDNTLTVGEDTYEGYKFSWDSTTANNPNAAAPISNFDASKTPNLHIGFYTDSEIKFGVGNGGADGNTWAVDLSAHTTYSAGYHAIELDLSGIELSTFQLRFYFEDGLTMADLTAAKSMVIDSIVFYDNLEIVLDEATANVGYFNDITATETGISWNYDAASVNGYPAIAIPVNHWYSFVNRYIILDVSLSHDMKLGIGFTNNPWGNADLLAHVEYKKGDYKICLDAVNAATDNDLNKLWIYCDVGNASEVSLLKTVNIKNIQFSNVPALSSPNATVVTVDYAGRTITFDETKYQVATTEEFTEGTLLESGAAVTPGTTLYLREFRGEELSPITEIELPATELTTANAPTPDVTENMIRYAVTGYEYKMEGKDNDWKALGSWGNLTAGTEYTIQIRKVATEDAFASEVLTVKVTTKTASSSGNDNNPGNSGNEGNSNNNEGGKGGNGLAIGLGVGAAVIVCGVAAGLAVYFVKKRKK